MDTRANGATLSVFVTGATGVLGRPVVRLLVAKGFRVRALSRSPENADALRRSGAEPVSVDLFDEAALREALIGADAVLHLATKIPPTAQAGWPGAWEENDHIRRDGTRALVSAALAAGVRTFVYPSFAFVYPESGAAWVDAATTPVQSGGLLQSTLEAEREVERFAQGDAGEAVPNGERRGVALRMGAFYGPDAPSTRDQLRIAHRGIAPVPGPADGYVPAIWVDDAAAAVVAALERAPSGIYDVVDDHPLTRREVLAALAAVVGRKRLLPLPAVVVRAVAGPAGGLLMRSLRISNRRFKEATGWAPTVADMRAGCALLASGESPDGTGADTTAAEARRAEGSATPESPRPTGRALAWTRAGLAYLAMAGLAIGAWQEFWPLDFYRRFPALGHLWVSVDGPYNEHLVRDVGSAGLALGALALIALIRPTVSLVGATALTWLVGQLPHFIYHIVHIGLLPTRFDQIAQTSALAVAVLIPALLLSAAARQTLHSSAVRRGAPSGMRDRGAERAAGLGAGARPENRAATPSPS